MQTVGEIFASIPVFGLLVMIMAIPAFIAMYGIQFVDGVTNFFSMINKSVRSLYTR